MSRELNVDLQVSFTLIEIQKGVSITKFVCLEQETHNPS